MRQNAPDRYTHFTFKNNSGKSLSVLTELMGAACVPCSNLLILVKDGIRGESYGDITSVKGNELIKSPIEEPGCSTLDPQMPRESTGRSCSLEHNVFRWSDKVDQMVREERVCQCDSINHTCNAH